MYKAWHYGGRSPQSDPPAWQQPRDARPRSREAETQVVRTPGQRDPAICLHNERSCGPPTHIAPGAPGAVKLYPHYYLNGCRKLFEESDIVKLREAMRHGGKERGANQPFSSSRSHHNSGKSKNPPGGSMWAEAQWRVAILRQQKSGSPGNTRSR